MASPKIEKGHKIDPSIRLIARVHNELNYKLYTTRALLQEERRQNKELRQRIIELEILLSQKT